VLIVFILILVRLIPYSLDSTNPFLGFEPNLFLLLNNMLKIRHYFFAFLKLAFTVQFFLVFLNKEAVDSKIYIITKILFQVGLGGFMEYLLFKGDIIGISTEDKVLIGFAAGLLVFEGLVTGVPDLLNAYHVKNDVLDKINHTSKK